MPTQDLFKKHFTNPKQKFLDSGVICTGTPDETSKKILFRDDHVSVGDQNTINKLISLQDVSSPTIEQNLSEVVLNPNGLVQIHGMSLVPEFAKIYFQLPEEFDVPSALEIVKTSSDIGFEFIRYNPDDFTAAERKTIRAKTHPMNSKEKHPHAITHINEIFRCANIPVEVSVEYVSDDKCVSGSSVTQSTIEGCMDDAETKKSHAYLTFTSFIEGYDFDVRDLRLQTHILSEDYPLSPYDKSTGAEPDIECIVLSQKRCMNKKAFRYVNAVSRGYALKMTYPMFNAENIPLDKRYIKLSHIPKNVEFGGVHSFLENTQVVPRPLFVCYEDEQNMQMTEDHESLPPFKRKTLSSYVKELNETDEWLCVGDFYMIMGVSQGDENLVQPIIIKNPNPFPIKVQILKYV